MTSVRVYDQDGNSRVTDIPQEEITRVGSFKYPCCGWDPKAEFALAYKHKLHLPDAAPLRNDAVEVFVEKAPTPDDVPASVEMQVMEDIYKGEIRGMRFLGTV